MKHYGDITKINGAEIEPVDVITGGSPCQDLSVAGKRAGLAGERSGLFMEQIRIVKEMRAKEIANGRTDCAIRPRFMVWENVPGAFSSNNGKDFQAVLAEIVRIVEPDAPDVPMPDKGKWTKSGCIYDEMGRWSVAWRVHDAQFWGVPQRRKRIALVADFGDLAAPEVLFERKGLSRHLEQGDSAGKGTSENVEGRVNPSRRAQDHGHAPIVIDQDKNKSYGFDGYNQTIEEEVAQPLRAADGGDSTPKVVRYGTGGGYVPMVTEKCLNNWDVQSKHIQPENGVAEALYSGECRYGGGESYVMAKEPVCIGDGQVDQLDIHDKVGAPNCMHDQQAVMCYGLDRASFNQGKNAQFDFTVIQDQQPTLTAKGPGAVCDYYVRRLTPTECERLQGYPDGWTDIGEWTDSKGKKHQTADSARYKALGNSIALPFWKVLARRISAQYDRDITMGSLFDGIGGFPLAFEHCGGKAVWASEIEEFPIAVTKVRFKE